jgi:hypothetical protein
MMLIVRGGAVPVLSPQIGTLSIAVKQRLS